MNKYEDLMTEVEESHSELSDEAKEAATDAMAFVASLHSLYAESHAGFGEFPDCSKLENLIDCIHGELNAVCMVLAEPAFDRVPDILREITASLETVEIEFNEDLQASTLAPSVVKGYSRLADRINMTKESISSFASRVETVRQFLKGANVPESSVNAGEEHGERA